MFGFRFDRYRWVHVVLASGAVGTGGCVDRAFHFGYVAPDTEGDTEGTTGDTTSDPTNPSDPSDPTVDPTDPTGTLPGVPGPPQLLEVRFINNITLELRFNEAMSPTTGVDPTQFRLSLGTAQNYYRYDYGTFTFYQEVGRYNGGENCYEYCYDPCDYDYDTGCETGGRMCYENCYPGSGPPVRAFSIQLDPGYSDRLQLGLDQGIASSVCQAIGNNAPENFESGLFLHFTDDGAPVADAQGESMLPIGERWALMPDEDFYYRPGVYFPDLVPFLPIPCPF